MAAGSAFLRELREFLRFLRSLWGVLAGISVLFPLSNVFFTAIPIEGGAGPFHNLPPAVVSVMTMLTCIFLTFATFGRRDQFTESQRRTRYARSARQLHHRPCHACRLRTGSQRPVSDIDHRQCRSRAGIALYDGLFAALYIATFALFTRAFVVLAMLEYFPEQKEAPA